MKIQDLQYAVKLQKDLDANTWEREQAQIEYNRLDRENLRLYKELERLGVDARLATPKQK